MAFSVRNLSMLAYANGFTLWRYKAGSDVLEQVGSRGFFVAASDMLTAGDIMMVSPGDGAQLRCVTPAAVTDVETTHLA